MRISCAAVTAILLTGLSIDGFADQSPANRHNGSTAARKKADATTPRGVSNADVIRMAKAGLSDAVIIASIQSAPARAFDVSPDGLLALKAAQVSDAVIAAVLPPSVSAPPIIAPPPPAPSVAPTPVASAHAPGLYLAGDRAEDLTPLEPTVFTQGKSGGLFTSAITYGIKKGKWKAIVRGSRAQFRVESSQPTFHFYFERSGSGLGNTGGFAGWLSGATSPNEFVLVKMKSKENERELIVGEFGLFGASSGTRSKDTIEMKIERLRPGVYRVTTPPLDPGAEYCFFYAGGVSMPGAGVAGKLFDFGVDAR